METLLSAAEIQFAVDRMGATLTERYADCDLVVVGVLKGSVIFLADLIRCIRVPLQLEFLRASSYRGSATSPGRLQLESESLESLRDRDVLIVDDIFDTGYTLDAVVDDLARFEPNSIATAVLLWKTARREVERTPDFHAFEIPDEFVVGYGLDFDGRYRHLPDVCILPGPES